MRLSILIATLDSRLAGFERVYLKLRGQIIMSDLHGQVEIISERDGGKMRIGHKRNVLLNRARGDYVSFVDDDDDVSSDYVRLLAAATRQGMDCVGITGRVHWHGKWCAFEHSLRHAAYSRTKAGVFLRPPNHLNPIRRKIALAHPFTNKDHGEDTDYAMAMVNTNALKSEVFVQEPVYWYTPAPGKKK